MSLAARKHLFNVFVRSLKIQVRIRGSLSFSFGAFSEPRGRVGSEFVLVLEPLASLLLGFWSGLLNVFEPLFERPASLFLELGDPLLGRKNAGMNRVD